MLAPFMGAFLLTIMESKTMSQAEQLSAQTGRAAKPSGPNKAFEDAFGFNPAPFALESLVSSKLFSPQKVVVYGVPGVGKTTFAATWPKPILLRTEDGAGALDIPTFPQIAQTTEDLQEAIAALTRGNHDFKTLILDSLDWAEPLVWKRVCEQGQKENIEDFGFGKGYVKVDDKWRGLQKMLDDLRQKCGMHIVCIAHAVPVTFDPPDSDSYQRYTLKMHKRASALWMEWAEMLLFINYKSRIVEAKDNGKSKAKGTGERVIYTQERPAYQAKTRWPLQDEIYIGNDPTWAEFHKQLHDASEGAYNGN